MRDFKLDERGDIVIKDGDLHMVSGNDLTSQRIRMIWGTQKGEWKYDESEGINTRAFIGKNPNTDEMLDNLRDGLQQVGEDLQLDECSFKAENRKLTISATVIRDSGEKIEVRDYAVD